MIDMKTAPDGLHTFDLQFAEAGLEGGRWKGAVEAFPTQKMSGLIVFSAICTGKQKNFPEHLNWNKRAIVKFIRFLEDLSA
jgi:hypothetical protein